MTDAVLVLPPGWRATDASDEPISGAKIKFFDSGTTTPKTVYSDQGLLTELGTEVTTDSGGYPVSGGSTKTTIYTGTASYKIRLTTSADVTVWEHDAQKGAVAIPTASSTALQTAPMVSKTTTYTILTTDQGKWINANPTSGSFALTLPSAVTAGDAFAVGIRHTGTANVVTYRTTASETITFAGQSKTAVTLTGKGQGHWLVSDGANWHVTLENPAFMQGNGLPVFRVTDRLTVPPSSPTGGNRYIINGTPTGAWATLSFADKQVVESDGNGSWFAYTPAEGWLAYVEDENVFTAYIGTAWTDLSNATAPTATTQPQARFINLQGDGNTGGNATSGSWATIPINNKAAVQSEISGAVLSTNDMVMPTGTYLVVAKQPFYGTYTSRMRLRNTTTAAEIYSDTVQAGITAVGPLDVPTGATALIMTVVTVAAATETFRLEYFVSSSRTGGLGITSTSIGVNESYAEVFWVSLASQQGPEGTQGIQGNNGTDGTNAGFAYAWSTNTSETDPTTGVIKGNSGTLASITKLFISETTAAAEGIAAEIAAWDDTYGSPKAKIFLRGATAGDFLLFQVTAVNTDNGTWQTLNGSVLASGGTLGNTESLRVFATICGDDGDVTAELLALQTNVQSNTTAAAASATAAATSATTATTSATSATTSATAAATSATTASTAATAAASSATAAATSATTATTQASNAASSASSASTSASTATTQASSASTSATSASTSATAAAASATAAASAAAAIRGTSTTSVAIGTGAKTFTTQAGKQWTAGQTLVIVSDANPATNYMLGTVTTYSSTSLVMDVTATGGSGTLADWTINVSGVRGIQGPAGSLDVGALSQVTPAANDKIVIGDTSNSNATAYVLPSALPISTAVQSALNDKAALTELASTSGGQGASLIGIQDAGGLITATTVEDALAEHRALINALDAAVILKGAWDASAGTFPGAGAAQAGWSYIVSVGGTVDSQVFTANDRIMAILDNASASVYATNWLKLDYTDQVLSVAGKTGAVSLVQADVSGLTTADSPQLAAVNLGHASDTTISRASAGVISVDGQTIYTNSIARTVVTLAVEVGHATDTTISRSAAGVIAVESVPLYSQIPQNSRSAAYTLVLADAQKHIFHPSADTTARTWTIPADASVAFPIGTAVTFVNQNGGGVITIAITTDTMRLAGAGTTGSRTLAANGVATALKITSTEWIISGAGVT